MSDQFFDEDLREYTEWLATHPGKHTAWEIWQAAADAARNPGIYVEDPSDIKHSNE